MDAPWGSLAVPVEVDRMMLVWKRMGIAGLVLQSLKYRSASWIELFMCCEPRRFDKIVRLMAVTVDDLSCLNVPFSVAKSFEVWSVQWSGADVGQEAVMAVDTGSRCLWAVPPWRSQQTASWTLRALPGSAWPCVRPVAGLSTQPWWHPPALQPCMTPLIQLPWCTAWRMSECSVEPSWWNRLCLQMKLLPCLGSHMPARRVQVGPVNMCLLSNRRSKLNCQIRQNIKRLKPVADIDDRYWWCDRYHSLQKFCLSH